MDNAIINNKEVSEVKINNKKVSEVKLNGAIIYSDAEMPTWMKEHLIVWYDIERQGYTLEEMLQNPVLIDLTGNGHNMTINYFDGTSSYISEDTRSLVLNLNDSIPIAQRTCGIIPNLSALTDFTVIIDKKLIMDPLLVCSWGSKFEVTPDNNYNRIFNLSTFASGTTHYEIFGKKTTPRKPNYSEGISIVTPSNTDGCSTQRGTLEDSEEFPLMLFRNAIIYGYYAKGKFYSFMLFDKTLTLRLIEYLKNHYFDKQHVKEYNEWLDATAQYKN